MFPLIALAALCPLRAAAQPAAAPDDVIESSRPAATMPLAKGDEPFLDPVWPGRVRTKDGAMGIARELPGARWEFDRAFWGTSRLRDADKAAAQALLDALSLDPPPTLDALDFEGSNNFTVHFVSDKASIPVRRTPGAFSLVALTARSAEHDRLALERTWFVFYDPLAARPGEPAPAPRGVALLMPGIFGTPEGTIESLVRAMRQRGWCVLRQLAQPSRFTESVEFVIDPAGDLPAAATRVADTLGQRAAEVAYAVELAQAHVDSARPALAKLPRVVIGFSGGAITTPVVIARQPHRYAAAILVGGGADYWLINSHSTYADMISSIRTRWSGRAPTETERAAFATAYRAAAPLDSFHLAAFMRDIPSLHVIASADSAVPRALGDLLTRRIGPKAQTWSRPGEHLPLFMALPKDYPAMLDWLDAYAPVAGAAPAPGRAPSPQPAGVP